MSRDLEAHIIAAIKAAAAPLSRPQLWDVVSEHFAAEAELAQFLLRMVDEGSLARTQRPRLDARPEYVYSLPQANAARLEVIAAAAASIERPEPAPAHEEVPEMKADIVDKKILVHLAPSRGWLKVALIAKHVGASIPTVRARLAALASENQIQSTGKRHGVHYAGLEAAPLADGKKPTARARRKPKATRSRRHPAAPVQTSAPRPMPAPPNGTRRFGYFSDGALQIDCPECKGVLSQEDLVALRDFVLPLEEGRIR